MERLKVVSAHLSGNVFSHLQLAPSDPILGISLAFNADPHPQKIDLGIGAYRDDQGKPYIFSAVREAERRILQSPNVKKEYLPIDGSPNFNRLTRDLLFGSQSHAVLEKRVASVQTISGTASLRVGAEFLATHLRVPAVYVPRPTWDNHFALFGCTGLQVLEYPYWDPVTRGFDFQGMMTTLASARPGSVIVLHACAHNPTGIDPSRDQWQSLATLMQEHQLLPYFDVAYQGFATGNIDQDAYSFRLFVDLGMELLASQSFEKCFGLYAEPIGALHIVCTDESTALKVLSQIKLIVRPMYSSPSLHASQIVNRILSDPDLRKEWETELRSLTKRIKDIRERLVAELQRLEVKGDWSHILKQKGMFSYTGLTEAQCERLERKWHCYLLKNGRVSMAGVNSKNVSYFATALRDVISS